MINLDKNLNSNYGEQFVENFEHVDLLIQQGQFQKAAEFLSKLHYADLADFLDNINHKVYRKILPLIDNIKPETLERLNNSSKQPVIEAIGIENSAKLIENLDIEDAIEIAENIDKDTRVKLLQELSYQKRYQIIEGFTYPEGSIGRILKKDFIVFQDYFKVEDAIKYIRSDNIEKNHYAAIIVDNKYKPVGTILLSNLLKYSHDSNLKSIMNRDFKLADVYTKINEVAFLFKQYSLTIIPVVNKNNKLVGIISIDNMIYVVEQQTEKDIMFLAGIQTSDTFNDLITTAKNRFPWLFVNLLTSSTTSIVISKFNTTMSKFIIIVAIMPIVASMGGNAGTQAMTVTVRALANKDIGNVNVSRVIAKEVLVSTFNGFLLGCIGAAFSFCILKIVNLSLVFAIAIIINFFIAGFCGAVIPITLYRFGIDPATASGVFLTALTDSLGFFTFLTLAYYFIV